MPPGVQHRCRRCSKIAPSRLRSHQPNPARSTSLRCWPTLPGAASTNFTSRPGKLHGSFVREGLVDEYLSYIAPMLIGEGRELAAFGPLVRLDDGIALRFVSLTKVGDDLQIVARPVAPGSMT